ncbi:MULTISPECIES: hypothetical protein [Sphingobacterium]|uniref:hypothetical protein n=1 Tax=Sphingobacterium TaxID=28453 RepID=UPI0013D9224D|nr:MULTISPECIES: hypothetical protein [unclassified Sphingobacterium]
MEKITLFLTVLCFALTSCTKEKTDYQAEIDTIVPGRGDFEEVTTIQSGNYNLHLEALNGTLYKGYNAIRVKVTDRTTNNKAEVSAVTLLPILSRSQQEPSSCPHRYQLIYKPEDRYFEGYIVFTEQTLTNATWDLYINFTVALQTQKAQQRLQVEKQDNKNLNITEFSGIDGEDYVIALVAPHKPKAAENELIAGIYKRNEANQLPSSPFPNPAKYAYTEVKGHTLKLDPRMPGPSMGNHSSPNNQDLIQRQDGLYQGVVNYTMTGNWTLNFILLNQHGSVIKGTTVPSDFTPGVEGKKSELHIDILF